MEEMEVLYSKHYVGRDIFIIEKDKKIINCYRSSGLSGTGHGGEILPFSGLNSGRSGFDTPGYIYKEFYLGKRWVNHRKDLKYYCPEAFELMEEIKELVKDIHPEDVKEVESVKQILELANTINNEMKEVSKDKAYFDFEVLIK